MPLDASNGHLSSYRSQLSSSAPAVGSTTAPRYVVHAAVLLLIDTEAKSPVRAEVDDHGAVALS